MDCDIENNFIIAKLRDGEDLFESITAIVEKYNIRSAIIVSGIGMLKEFEIGFFENGVYHKETYEEPHELVSLHGSIAFEKKKLLLHMHAGLARKDHSLRGGHLFSAKVCWVNELVLLKLDEVRLVRKLNKKSGLSEMEIEQD